MKMGLQNLHPKMHYSVFLPLSTLPDSFNPRIFLPSFVPWAFGCSCRTTNDTLSNEAAAFAFDLSLHIAPSSLDADQRIASHFLSSRVHRALAQKRAGDLEPFVSLAGMMDTL